MGSISSGFFARGVFVIPGDQPTFQNIEKLLQEKEYMLAFLSARTLSTVPPKDRLMKMFAKKFTTQSDIFNADWAASCIADEEARNAAFGEIAVKLAKLACQRKSMYAETERESMMKRSIEIAKKISVTHTKNFYLEKIQANCSSKKCQRFAPLFAKGK
jgi:hypothetical protein